MYGDKRLEKPQQQTVPAPSTHGAHLHHQHLHHSHHGNHQPHSHAPHPSQQQHQQHQVQQQQQQLTAQQQQQHQQQQQQQHHHQPTQSQQQNSAMFTRFDTNKSTKGASKLRRDLINAEIANLRDLLPLPQSTRQRLSQLQLMALVCVYVRKANYFQQVFKRHDTSMHHTPTPNIGFSKALSGFLMMLTQNGKLLYISDNAAEYLGHSMEDLLIHGDSVYDIIDKQDHGPIQAELNRNVPQQPGQNSSAMSSLEGEHRMFLCRMNVSRNARRQMRFGDQKVVLVQGHYLSFLPLCSRNEPVFLATCTPIAMPETRECVVQGATNVFTTIHSMDMKIVHVDKNGEFHLGYSKLNIQGLSWYHLIHSDNLREAQNKHRLITQSEQDRSCILLVRIQRRQGDFIWVHVVLQVRDSQDSNQQPVIVCTNQVLNEREATVMVANSWLYHYYTVQSKIQFGLPFEGPTRVPPTTPGYYHHHHLHQHSPTLASNLPHGYPPPHHVAYSYHSPVGIAPPSSTNHQSSPAHIMGHHNGNGNNGMVGHYAYRIESQPVDYSQGPITSPTSHVNLRCSSANSSSSSITHNNNNNILTSNSTNNNNNNNNSKDTSNNSNNNNKTINNSSGNNGNSRLSSPPASKRRAVSKLEPLYIADSNHDSPEAVTDLDVQYCQSEHGSVAFETVVPTRHRILTKAPPPDPPDFIEIWNPSPPWSETAQKVPDMAQQQLSPYMTTTPPGSAPPTTIGPAFSFDWMSEQFVPILDPCGPCVPCLTQDGTPVQLPMQIPLPHHHWPPDHRILPLQQIANGSPSSGPLSGHNLKREARDEANEKDSPS